MKQTLNVPFGGELSIMFIVGNGISNSSSDPGQGCFCFTLH